MTITVDDVPDAVDDAFSTNEDTPLTADVSQNDVPSVDGTNTYGVVTGVGQGPNHGSLSWNNNGSFVYTPDTNFSGNDTFDYVLSDADGDQSTGTVSITINSVDVAPVAESKSLTVDEDSPGTNLGLLTPTTPDAGETLTVTVTQVPGTGEGIISNAETPLTANDTITPSELAGLTFIPNSNYDGTVTAFIYSLSDGTSSNDGTVTIAITPQNDAPIGVDDAFNTTEDTALAGDVSINDTPGDGQNTYSIVSTEAPNHGTLALNSNGSFDYEPDLNFIGTDTFGYQFSDDDGESANATVTINVLDSQLDDDDGDGVIDSADAYPNVSLNGLADSDNDGAPDICDATCVGLGMQADIFPNDANEWLDHDNDGVGDNADLDDDNDGVTDSTDLYPFDSDNDGTDNSFDADDDNDGILDEDDTYPLISILGYFPDSDSDGAPNNCDSVCLATGMQADADDDNDGVADVADDLPLNELAATDSDGDGYADEYLPSSITFLGEAGLDIEDLVLDRTIYALDAFPSNQSEWRDADGDGTGDNADVDDDNDGVSDALDLLPEDANWNTAATPTTAVGTQLIARYKGALANPSINFTDPRNGATIELTGSQSGQFINDLGSTAFVWQTDVEGWLALQADLTDLTHAIPFDIPVSGLRDLVTDGLINTLALDSSYGANLFTVQEVVAELRLIKVGDEPGVTETYAMETTYGYYIENAALRAQVLTEMLIQQPDRVDQARELILGFTSLEAVSFIRGDLASSSPILQDGLPFGGTQTLSILPSELASVSSFSTLELDQFPVVPEALLPAPYDFGADVDTQVALFSASGQGTLEGDPSCALSWTASASTLELTVTQVPNASTCISLGDVHSITPLFFDETSETLLYVRSSIGSETHTRLMLDRRDVLGPNLDASAIASLLTSEQVLVSGEQLVDPTDYIGDGFAGFILDLGDIDAVVLKNDGTISADNLPVDGTARYVNSVTPGAVQSEDWQWILTTQGIEFDDPATSATSTIDPVSGQLTTIPDVHWRILELDEDNRLWVIETEIIPSTPYTESRLNFYTVLNQDQDGDLEADLDEVIANTDPFTFNDADGDGLSDFDETNNTGTNPAIADSDGDGVTDGIDADPLRAR